MWYIIWGDKFMKFELIIDDSKEEKVVVTAHNTSPLTEEIKALVLRHGTDKIVAFDDEDIVMLSTDTIECITILDGRTVAVCEDGRRYRIKQRLYEIESILPPTFIKINKSSLANEQRIARFSTTISGAVDAVFMCGYKEYVSRRCFSEIKRRYDI